MKKFFQAIKGNTYGLDQFDKVLPLIKAEDDAVDVERGTCLVLTTGTDGEPVFERATDVTAQDTGLRVYFSLHSEDDYQANAAGTGFTGGVPVIGALDCGAEARIETEMYEPEGEYSVGTYLTTSANGLLTPVTDALMGTVNIVGQVEKAPDNKWRNEVQGISEYHTGGNVDYITFRSMWLPANTIET